jgi:hypothetical protein
MATLDKLLIPGLLAVASLYILYTQPFQTALMSYGVAALLYVLSQSKELALGVLILSVGVGGFRRILGPQEPVGVAEAFQPKNPISIHTRLETEKGKAPLAPKVEAVTGVLESPSILDNVPLKPYQELTSDAKPGKSIPASAKARVLIYPPEEGFVPAPGQSKDKAPKENPFLQNGPDDDSVESAMMARGTDLPPMEVVPSDMPSVGADAPAF